MLCQMLDNGFDAHGMDLSADMLAVARRKLDASGYRPLLFQQDLSRLEAPSPYSVVTAFCDTINYLIDEAAVKDALRQCLPTWTQKDYFCLMSIRCFTCDLY